MKLPGDYELVDEQQQPESEEERRQYWERQHEHAEQDRDGHP